MIALGSKVKLLTKTVPQLPHSYVNRPYATLLVRLGTPSSLVSH